LGDIDGHEQGCHLEVGELRQVSWRKSSWSGYSGNCIEVAGFGGELIGVRDSKENGMGAILRFDHGAWSSFIAGVKNGDFGG
jgi:hypothetical protein